MITSGEVFLLNGGTGGAFQAQPCFLNRNIRVLAAGLDRAYIACEPPVKNQDRPQKCSIWCYRGAQSEPELCPEFDTIQGRIRQIAIGSKHVLVLTYEGVVYSRGSEGCGCVGQGGAKGSADFKPIPALENKKVKLVAAGPMYSVAVTHEGDVYSWGQAFQGETGLLTTVEAVPRYANLITPKRVAEVSCGHGHALARTEGQQCIAWGENTCGQLGIGQKSKPTCEPKVLDAIPSQIAKVSAGWAHSVAVGTDGRVYAWGLNSHGQLGLGDTVTRFSPHLLHELVGAHQVCSAHATKTFTIFRTSTNVALLCGQVPCGPNSKVAPEFVPRRPAEKDVEREKADLFSFCGSNVAAHPKDPAGCLLSPVPLEFAKQVAGAASHSELSDVVAFDKGALAFATSTVYRVEPNLAPSHGGTVVQAFVTGLPFQLPRRKRASDEPDEVLIQDTIPVKVKLKSTSPNLDVVVPGKIVGVDTVQFLTPDVAQSPLGSAVEKGATTAAVEVQVSIDSGFTWTPARQGAPTAADLEKTARPLDKSSTKARSTGMTRGLTDFKGQFEDSRHTRRVADLASMVLWITRWPQDGPEHVTPCCSPVTGGTEILLLTKLPSKMPTQMLTVKFVCTPLQSIGDKTLEAQAPLLRDVSEIINPCRDTIASLPLATPLEVPVSAWLDPTGRGVRAFTPPFVAEHVKFYKYSVELSLDGKSYLGRALPFAVFDLKVTGLEPNLGPLTEGTEVVIKADGFIRTDVQRVRLDFPKDLGWPSRMLPAAYDHTTGEVSFVMPDVVLEMRQRADEERMLAASLATPLAAGREEGAADGAELDAEAAVDPDAGLGGLEVFVELSLNGQNFTEDRVHFTYHSGIVAGALEVLDGVVAEPVKEDPKAAKNAKKSAAAEEASKPEPLAKSGTKLGAEFKRGAAETAFAAMRAELCTKVGDEPHQLLRVVDLPGSLELLPVKAAPTPPLDPKAPTPPAPLAEEQQMRDVLVAYAPGVKIEDLPDGATLYMRNFQVSLNGKCFTACPDAGMVKLEPLPKQEEDS